VSEPRGQLGDFEERVRQLVEGELDDAAQQALADQLREDDDALQFYVEYVSLHGLLKRRHAQPAEQSDQLSVISIQLSTSAEGDSSNLTLRPSRKSWLNRASRRPVRPSLGVAAVVMVALLVTMGTTSVSKWIAGKSDKQQTAPDKDEDTAPVESVARLVDATGAKWQGSVDNPLSGKGQQIKTGMRLYRGQKLNLTAGMAEFKFFHGAEVVLQAPAVLEVIGKKQCSLVYGKLTARVEQKGSKGFIVDTPKATVEDLGTEFTVYVNATGDALLGVSQGHVSLTPKDVEGELGENVFELAKGASVR